MSADNKERERAEGGTMSRRGFMVASLAAGFALAVRPVSAETITTDSQGLTAGEVKIAVAGGQIPAYRAMPAKGGPFPSVLVIHEIFGVHEHIKDICRRLAKVGYFAVAPLLFAREGDVSRMADYHQIMQVVMRVPDAQVLSDLDATAAWAKASGSADPARMGVVGFCWGGRQAWLYAAHNSSLRAGAAWYGLLAGPHSPLTVVKQLNVPVLGLYGGADSNIPLALIHQMQAEIKADHKPCEIVIYPDAPHGFNADYRPSYRPAAAKDGWNRMLAWYREHGLA